MTSENQKRQLVVLGAGPGGYAAAFLAADLGMKVTLIDKESNPGGVCLYRGCIPSKALLHAAKVIADAKSASSIGIKFGEPEINIDRLRSWKESVVKKLTLGVGSLSKQRQIEYLQGTARFESSTTLKFTSDQNETISFNFEHCILATGSHAAMIPGIDVNEDVWDSTKALELNEIPESLLVIGGGYIGLELGSVYATLGSQVSVVEMTESLMPGTDADLVQVFQRQARKVFRKVMLETKVESIQKSEDGLHVQLQKTDGSSEDLIVQKVLVAIGRKSNSSNLGLENTQVTFDELGFVQVNEKRQTNDPSIYAIGDVTGGMLLAHKASREGRVAVESILGKDVLFNPKAIPGVVYTDPEIAFTGLTEKEALSQNLKIKVLKYPWQASGRAASMQIRDGLTKLIVDVKSEKILGGGIVGNGVGDMISEISLAIEKGCTVHDIANVIHPHPTLSETIMEAAELFDGTCTHLFSKE